MTIPVAGAALEMAHGDAIYLRRRPCWHLMAMEGLKEAEPRDPTSWTGSRVTPIAI
jgi:hypothetical protein